MYNDKHLRFVKWLTLVVSIIVIGALTLRNKRVEHANQTDFGRSYEKHEASAKPIFEVNNRLRPILNSRPHVTQSINQTGIEQMLVRGIADFLDHQSKLPVKSRGWLGPIPKVNSVKIINDTITIDFSSEIASEGESVFESNYGLMANLIHQLVQGDMIEPSNTITTIIALVNGKSIKEVFP